MTGHVAGAVGRVLTFVILARVSKKVKREILGRVGNGVGREIGLHVDFFVARVIPLG